MRRAVKVRTGLEYLFDPEYMALISGTAPTPPMSLAATGAKRLSRSVSWPLAQPISTRTKRAVTSLRSSVFPLGPPGAAMPGHYHGNRI